MRDPMNAKQCSEYLKALGDPQRLTIIQCLQSGPRSVGELSESLGIAAPNVSHHLKVLREARLVVSRRKGRFIIYQIAATVNAASSSKPLKVLDLGCCRLEFGKR